MHPSCRFIVRAILITAIYGGVLGCASVSVKERDAAIHIPPARPERILVEPFSFDVNNVRAGRGGRDLEEFRSEVSAGMTARLLQRIPQVTGIPAQIASRGSALSSDNVWIVRGRFDRLNQGSRFLRSVVGLGAGGTKMETTVTVLDLSTGEQIPLCKLRTTGGSNISPGIGGVVTFWMSGPMALTSLFNVVEGARSGVSFDIDRTAREISAGLAEFLHENGLDDGRAPTPAKRIGSLKPLRLSFTSPQNSSGR